MTTTENENRLRLRQMFDTFDQIDESTQVIFREFAKIEEYLIDIGITMDVLRQSTPAKDPSH